MVKLIGRVQNALVCVALVLSFATPATSRPANNEAVIAMNAIHSKIKQKIITPINTPSAIATVIDVDVADNGYVTRIRMRQSSGFRHYDDAVMQAVIAAQPLPMPASTAARKDCKTISLTFTAGL